MTLSVKVSKGIEYMYFQAGRESLYIGPRHSPEKSKQENVIRALDYAQERTEHYRRSLDELLPLLPEKARDQYVARQIKRLRERIGWYSSLVSKS